MGVQGTAAWLAERKLGIGASEAGTVLGIDPYQSAAELLDRKLGRLPDVEDNAPMRMGRLLEPVVAQMYTEATGRPVALAATMLRHPSHDWMFASLDRVVPDYGILEIKTTRRAGEGLDAWGEAGTDEVPARVLAQVQQQLAVSGADVADVAVLIAGADLRIYTIEPDPEWFEILVERETSFMDVLRTGGTLPVDGSEASKAYLSKRYPVDNGAEMVADDDLRLQVELLLLSREKVKAYEGAERDYENKIKDRMGELSKVRDDGWTVSWKRTRDSETTDWKSLAAGFLSSIDPEEAAALVGIHTNIKPGARRFLVSTKGDKE